MDNEQLKRGVLEALANVENPRTSKSVTVAGQVEAVEVDDDGSVRIDFQLGSEDPGGLVKEVRTAVENVEGVTGVKVNVGLPHATSAGGPGAGGGGSVSGPGPGAGGGLQPGSVPAPTPKPGLLPDVDHVVAVSSGKGGVGKSMVAANMAAALAMEGHRVGLLDADIYGPDIPMMFGERRRPRAARVGDQEMIEPLETHGVKLMSLGFLLEEDQPAIMRGPLISGLLRQFLEQVKWDALDYLVVDMPPGTGDAQLSLVQTIDVDGAVLVTTPQSVSTQDVRRAIKMFERVNTPILGIVENMSGYVCPHCGEREDIFGSGGGEALAEAEGVAFLGRVPLDATVRSAGDEGTPTVVGHRESEAAKALREVTRALAESLGVAAV